MDRRLVIAATVMALSFILVSQYLPYAFAKVQEYQDIQLAVLRQRKQQLLDQAEQLLTMKQAAGGGQVADISLNVSGGNALEVSAHSSKDDCWIILFNEAYDVTDLVKTHSGGDVFSCGADNSDLFRNQHGEDIKRMKKYAITQN